MDIKEICKKYGIINYKINNGLVGVYGDVNITCMELDYLPLNFGKVTGSFYCSHNNLKSLKGSPIEVGGSFYCHNNKLKSLDGGPKYVGGSFGCHCNELISLKGSPIEVGGIFFCSFNNLLSTDCSTNIGGKFYLD